jgi:hypothetical protein
MFPGKGSNSGYSSATCSSPLFTVSLMLRTTVSRPVSLGIKHPSGVYDQISITISDERTGRLQLLLVLASVVILGFESCGTRGHLETSLFVASYDSQGHGGGIRPLLHTRAPILSQSQSHIATDYQSDSHS